MRVLHTSLCRTQTAVVALIASGDFWQHRRYNRVDMPEGGWVWKTMGKDWSPTYEWLTPDSDEALAQVVQDARDILFAAGMTYVDGDVGDAAV